jgi:ATP-binding cassette, subfamily B, heavy metal transporter
MWDVSKIIQLSAKKISFASFTHMQDLDINFHKTSSKNTVFAINRAIRSIETALRFTLGFATPIVVEFGMLVAMMSFFCGPKYLGNMMLTLGLYTYFSKTFSELRRVQMAEKKNAEKKSEFYLNESTINFESVKNFGNEELEKSRYKKLLDDLEQQSLVVQNSLGQLNSGQAIIYTTGMAINLFMAAHDVSLGTMTAGDFVLVQAYFMQLSGPLFNMGMMFREVGQTQVDLEDLVDMLERQPKIMESPNAVDFNYQKGSIKFDNITFGHLNDKKAKEGEEATQEKHYLFKDLTLEMEPGTTNAIVGPSGFGKTTILHLLFRMYDPE